MERLKIIGIGGTGCNILGKMPVTDNLLVLDTCVCPFNWIQFDKILCGKDICRGLGCGGSVEIGYDAARETLSSRLDVFDNKINLFVLGLGGGTGSGIFQFLSEQFKQNNSYNIAICTYPLDIEVKRKIKADSVLNKVVPLVDLILLVKLNELGNQLGIVTVDKLFNKVDDEIRTFLWKLLKLEKDEFLRLCNKYTETNKILEIKKYTDFIDCFPSKLSNKLRVNTHFTGQKRDIEQLKALSTYVKEEKSILFVGCSTGEEIIDFQEFANNKLTYFGTDYDSKIVETANDKNYVYPTKIFLADVLNDDFSSETEKKANFSKFDIIVCRNLLIYYDKETSQKIVERLADLTENILVLGISDPFNFIIDENKVKIGNNVFNVIDFGNKVFGRDKNSGQMETRGYR